MSEAHNDTPSPDIETDKSVPKLTYLREGGKKDPPTPPPDGREEEWSGYHALGLRKTGPPVGGMGGVREQKENREPPTLLVTDPVVPPDSCPTPNSGSSAPDETASNGNKDDEDEDDDDTELDKIDSQHYDPERLKAFNMFVRLFVDENLDRMVPISKQPKEKIQAIIDSCSRQFPEFSDRARKRIRTYLKSCRRNKRARDQTGWESSRPTPPHLTSVQAEQILALACENESTNAKRMRMGLEPISQPLTVTTITTTMSEKPPVLERVQASSPEPKPVKSEASIEVAGTPPMLHKAVPERPLMSDHRFMNGFGSLTTSISPMSALSSMYRPNLSQAFQRAGITYPANLLPTPPLGVNSFITNGPTDLSTKPKPPLTTHKLNATEIATVRQLITGYRESAAFLLRSADELEQLLLQQQ